MAVFERLPGARYEKSFLQMHLVKNEEGSPSS